MPILFGYLARFFLLGFLKMIGVFIGLFLLIDGIEGIRRFSQKPNFQLFDFGLLLASRLPNFLGMLTPSLVLLTTLMGVSRLVRQNEITVMRASGLSLSGILLPFLGAGVLITLLHAALIGEIAPLTNRIAQDFKDRIQDQQVAPLSRTDDLWIRDGAQIIHAKRFDPDSATLYQVTIFTFDDEHRLTARLEAKTAHHDGQSWQLMQGIDYRFLPESTVESFPQRLWPVALDPQRLAVDTPPPQMLTVRELYALSEQLQREGHDATRYEMLFHRRLATPFSNLASILLAFPFALRLPRSGGALRSMLVGLLLGFVMFVFGDLAGALGMGGRLPPVLAAWAPILFFTGIAGYLLLHLTTPKRLVKP
ncbi:MAG: LPS export ABC transporter permease LptG [Magnetococcales bacterium]|nr:LPS export ABC transporter permease LptG [Magnetococcales bacterium]